MNILFVCTGNTCRSPMAAVLMNKEAMERSLDVRIESAGIFAHEGDTASSEAIAVMKEYGIDLSEHRAKMITSELIEASDLILTMTKAHKAFFDNNAAFKTYTLPEYAGLDFDIDDPFGGTVEDYRHAADQIYEAVKRTADKIEKEMK